MLSQQRDKIREAFTKGTLRIQSVSPSNKPEWKPVVAVHRAEIGPESVWKAETEDGPLVLTGGHRVFLTANHKAEMETLEPGQGVLGLRDGVVGSPILLSVGRSADRQFMYDLTAADWHNFVLHRSKVVISNSPDRNAKFRPPEHEGDIGCYNQVFGFLWEDNELIEYLNLALDSWNMLPPETESLCSLDLLTTQKPVWRTAVIWGALTHALMALSINWISEEFDYSIGGISLSIDRSSKYESMKQNAEQQFDKAGEAKARTTKYLFGLRQPKFGSGARSAWGPHLGSGVNSPRKFV